MTGRVPLEKLPAPGGNMLSRSPHLRKSPSVRGGVRPEHSCSLSLIVFINWLLRKTRALYVFQIASGRGRQLFLAAFHSRK